MIGISSGNEMVKRGNPDREDDIAVSIGKHVGWLILFHHEKGRMMMDYPRERKWNEHDNAVGERPSRRPTAGACIGTYWKVMSFFSAFFCQTDAEVSLLPINTACAACLIQLVCVRSWKFVVIHRHSPLPSVRPHQLLLHVGAQVCLLVSDGWSARRVISMGKIHSSSAPWHITYGLVSFNRSINALPFSSSKYRPRACTFYLQVGRDCTIK